ncbi:unnamed protein product [Adineta ricciae]|uniref:Uncharacterized protein n=1 Tax=Adineta ricciae TaxID=249248 RepID=A0A815IGN9_ADIRI|nr:unnamed protein product [Adineta ricciae]
MLQLIVRIFQRFRQRTNQNNSSKEFVSFFSLFRFAQKSDWFYITVATLAAIASGITFTISLMVFGSLTGVFIDEGFKPCSLNTTTPNELSTNFKADIHRYVLYLVGLGCLAFVLAYTEHIFWTMSSEKQAKRIRNHLFRSLLHKGIAYFDKCKSGEHTTRLSDDIDKVQKGIGEKLGVLINSVSIFLSSCIIAFIKSWKLALVLLSITPVLVISAYYFAKTMAIMTANELKSTALASGAAEEVFTSIRTVFAYNGSEYEQTRYGKYIDEAKHKAVKKGFVYGLFTGFTSFVGFCFDALGFWYGAKLIREDSNQNIGIVILVLFTIVEGVYCISMVIPHFQGLSEARGAAYHIWQLIDISPKQTLPVEPLVSTLRTNFMDTIEFRNVHFSYPTRLETQVLNGLSFKAQRGQKIALVGSSGCGKSTCVQLLLRFYDVKSGEILFEDRSITDLDVNYVRQNISVVNQEPILFGTTIFENIKFGCPTATVEQIEEAARKANAHDFIMRLPEKYYTVVGERGAQLSGGQKQRVALARALVSDPKILILDEATSALDRISEKAVQKALDNASEGRTTIIIAHRLSAIVAADNIVVIQKGCVVEEGNHELLMRQEGVYYQLVQAQEAENVIYTSEDEYTTQYNQNDEILLEDEFAVTNSMNTLTINSENTSDKDKKNTTSETDKVFQECDYDLQIQRIQIYAGIFLSLGVVTFLTKWLQSFMFACSGEALTRRLRAKAYKTMLCQEVAWFDRAENNSGALTTRLSTDASAVQNSVGIRIGASLEMIANLGAGLILAFIFSWQLASVMIGFTVVMIVAGFAETYLTERFSSINKQKKEEAGSVAAEVLANMRTVVQLQQEDFFFMKYKSLVQAVCRSTIKRSTITGAVYALTTSIPFFILPALFSFGFTLIEKRLLKEEDILLIFAFAIFLTQALAVSLSMVPDYGDSISAAEDFIHLFNRKPAIDNSSTAGTTLSTGPENITMTDLEFAYPGRKTVNVLKKLTMHINQGQRVALIGPSGCGKSTVVQLLERFYDISNGALTANACDVRSLNLHWYRGQIGIVSQEPILFDISIRENIAYGDHSRQIPLSEIIEAAKTANAHDMIQKLPQGYDTIVGLKGVQMSGGEKQRIAIARALIHNPSILLLDEATSALDSANEKIVQDALERAQENRTSLTITHRLSTIRNADVIYVIHNGQIVEFGTHEQLLLKEGSLYVRLLQMQSNM